MGDLRRTVLPLMLLGDGEVGKTSLILRLTGNQFNDSRLPTIGKESYIHQVNLHGYDLKMKLWDTAGQERFKSMAVQVIKTSDAVILVYAINSKTSFETLDFWYNSVQEKLGEDEYILAIVGSKSDLTDDEEVSEELARKFAKEKKAFFKLVSAKEDPTGINSLFNTVLDILIKSKYLDKRNISTVINKKDHNKKKKKKGFC